MSNNKHEQFYGLDHLRALAITLVFLFHYSILSHQKPVWLADAIKFGWTGVDLFFVLSGFLISNQLFKQIKSGKNVSFGNFFLKRFFRIVPAYLVVVAIYFCVPFFREKESLPPLWKFLTFTQNIGLDIKHKGTFSHCWSLCVEEHFYLLLPLTLIFLQWTGLIKRSYWLLIALFIGGFVIRHFSYNNFYLPHAENDDSWIYWYKYIYYPSYTRLDGLLAGVSIAAVYQFLPTVWNKLSKYGNLMIVAGLVLLASTYFICSEEEGYNISVIGFPLVDIGFGCIVAGAISSTSFLYKWKSGITSKIAMLAYTIYLTHKGVIHITHQLLGKYDLDENLLLLISIFTSLAGAYVLHITVERTFLKWRDRILSF